MSRTLVTVSGSPSSTSRSAFVARAVTTLTERAGLETRAFSIRDFDAEDSISGRTESDGVKRFLEAVERADALVLSTPVYKGAYTGALKAVVDLLPYEGLVGRPVLGIATARVEAHIEGVDAAYRALFGFFRARPVESLVVLDHELRLEGAGGSFLPDAEARVHRAAEALHALVAASAVAKANGPR